MRNGLACSLSERKRDWILRGLGTKLEGDVTFWRHFSWVSVSFVPITGKCPSKGVVGDNAHLPTGQ